MFMKVISLVEEAIVFILTAILVVLTFINVILRYFFNYSISGSVEISILLFAWIIFVGSSMAFKYKNHISIDIVEALLPTTAKKILNFMISTILLVFTAVMSVYGTVLTINVLGESLGATTIPKSLVYSAFPVGFGLMTIRLIQQLFKTVKGEG
ncbi:hypothetical protein A0U40_10915 [[Bacillus] sp. KCTC 13219]|uniref:TRAP transporter small permease n=1 Tax=Metasolibacillus fluoroglycofenilyticus TaxID=1239396 RepID=UPI000792CA40|nr:TRAP transporter small permease [Metasolibacillus fluoroglycofenilyticus]KYG89302.1 hypothetical protein A0U40_10915 [[Bacillus] sp. KCTC 13219]